MEEQAKIARKSNSEKSEAENQLPKISPSTRVIELGAGIAPLPSLVTGLFGARKIIATDYIPDLVEMCQENLDINRGKFAKSQGHTELDLPELDMRAELFGFGDPVVFDPVDLMQKRETKIAEKRNLLEKEGIILFS